MKVDAGVELDLNVDYPFEWEFIWSHLRGNGRGERKGRKREGTKGRGGGGIRLHLNVNGIIYLDLAWTASEQQLAHCHRAEVVFINVSLWSLCFMRPNSVIVENPRQQMAATFNIWASHQDRKGRDS